MINSVKYDRVPGLVSTRSASLLLHRPLLCRQQIHSSESSCCQSIGCLTLTASSPPGLDADLLFISFATPTQPAFTLTQYFCLCCIVDTSDVGWREFSSSLDEGVK